MHLGYNRWTEEQDKARLLVPDGKYTAEITSAIAKMTKNGLHKMLEIELSFNESGRTRKVKDWIVFMEGMDWKLRHLALSIDSKNKNDYMIGLYDSDQLNTQHILNKIVMIDVGSKDSDKGKMNVIRDYLVFGESVGKTEKQDMEFVDNNDIPF